MIVYMPKLFASLRVSTLQHNLYRRVSVRVQSQSNVPISDDGFVQLDKHEASVNSDDAGNMEYLNAKPFAAIPGPKQTPAFGNLLDYRFFGKFSPRTYHHALADRYQNFGPLVRENFGGRRIVHVFDPEDARIIYQNEGKIPYVVPLQESALMYRTLRELSLGLGNMNGNEWYRLKRNVQKAMLRPQSVFAYMPMVDAVARDFVQYIRSMRLPDNRLPTFKNDVAKWSLESSGLLVFEKRLRAFNSTDANSTVQKLIDTNAKMFTLSGLLKFSLPLFKYISTPKWRKLVEAEDYFYAQVNTLINEAFDRIKELQSLGETVGEDQFNFIGYLLSKPELSQKDVYIICLSLFGDGLNTTAPALIYNAYCLASNKEVQEKLFNEIRAVVGSKGGTLTVNLLQNMPYLKACVKECFRLYPIGSEVSRVLKKNLVLSGYQVPAGTHIEINMGPQLKSARYFTDPLKFMPERWIKDVPKEDFHPFVLTPFGHGPRMCAGRRFAEQDLYVALANLVTNFRIEHCGKAVDQEMHTLLLPTNTEYFLFIDR